MDVIIIGGGPAGLCASIYCARALLKTLVIEEQAIGGQMVYTTEIENYPGFPEGIMGPELGMLMEKQAKRFGVEILYESVKEIDVKNKKIITNSGEFSFKALIIATGASPMKLNLPKEEQFTGRGVSYCATCDGAFYRDQTVAVVGGGNTAIEEAIFLTNFASKVYIIHRRDKFRAERFLQKKALENKKIEPLWNKVVVELLGEESLSGVKIRDTLSGKEEILNISGLFIFVGYKPKTDIVNGIVELDNEGYIITNEYRQTSVEFIFAAGDCVKKPYKQVATAVGDGCTAAMSAIAYLEKMS